MHGGNGAGADPQSSHALVHSYLGSCCCFAPCNPSSAEPLNHGVHAPEAPCLPNLPITPAMFGIKHASPCSDFKANADPDRRASYNRHYAFKGRGRKEFLRSDVKEEVNELVPTVVSIPRYTMDCGLYMCCMLQQHAQHALPIKACVAACGILMRASKQPCWQRRGTASLHC